MAKSVNVKASPKASSAKFDSVDAKPKPINSTEKSIGTDEKLLLALYAAGAGLLVYAYYLRYTNSLHSTDTYTIFNSFSEFYPFYLGQHQDPICRRLHFVGTSIIMVMVSGLRILLCITHVDCHMYGFLIFHRLY